MYTPNLWTVVAAFALVTASPPSGSSGDAARTCGMIAQAIGASAVFYPGSPEYTRDIDHFSDTLVQRAMCSVEPGTPGDVGIVLMIVGRHRTPFAVKGGGATLQPGFSSTKGAMISLTRFRKVDYDSTEQTVRIGVGLKWEEVYSLLEPLGVSVAGGRAPGIGVAGFTLSGGHSWKTSQHGLACDTVLSYELVLSNGTVKTVTKSATPDLFFALRGGGKYFGIVTEFTFKAFPQTAVWGGNVIYDPSQAASVRTAVANFAHHNTDPKAQVIDGNAFFPALIPVPIHSTIMFYDAPTPPPGLFDEFVAIPALVPIVGTQTFVNFVSVLADPNITRALFTAITVTEYTPTVLEALANETAFWGPFLAERAQLHFLSFSAQPFLSNYLTHTTSPSAYPPSRAPPGYSTEAIIMWDDPTANGIVLEAARQSSAHLRTLSGVVDIRSTGVYPGYALPETPVEGIYGKNLKRLKKISHDVDPHGVMELTGGFGLR